MKIFGLFLLWQIGLIVAIMNCLTSFKGEVTRHDMNNIFLPIGPGLERLDQNTKLVKAIRYLFAAFAVGMLLFVGIALLLKTT